jgi:hypothetical protein
MIKRYAGFRLVRCAGRTTLDGGISRPGRRRRGLRTRAPSCGSTRWRLARSMSMAANVDPQQNCTAGARIAAYNQDV